jgi:plasmid stability protein
VTAITIRDVPEPVRNELAARAARSGRSLQEYLLAMLSDSVAHPLVEDVIARARERVTTTGARLDVESILAARDSDRR